MINTHKVIKVGIADLNIVKAPDTIRTSGLGSCVGTVIYDLPKRIAGLAHIMLPDSALARESNKNLYKYADTAMTCLIEDLLKNGARKHALKAKLAGGAQMFRFAANSDSMRIGPRNIEAVEKALYDYDIPIIASDLGGNSGRTIEFNPVTGELYIRTINKGKKVI